MNGFRVLSSGKRGIKEQKSSHAPLQPYARLPFSPILIQKAHPPKEAVRKEASRQIEGHFGKQHNQYKSRENRHSSKFKISTKKTDIPSSLEKNEVFWMEKLGARNKGLR